VSTTRGIRSEREPKKIIPANAQNRYEITIADLPLHCPMDGMSLWNSHPRVFLPIEETGQAKCPYCGAQYILSDRGGM
jgi:uncharacterized Zn-finger protein